MGCGDSNSKDIVVVMGNAQRFHLDTVHSGGESVPAGWDCTQVPGLEHRVLECRNSVPACVLLGSFRGRGLHLSKQFDGS